MLLFAAVAIATAGSTGTVVNFEDQPTYQLPTPESLFFRQYADVGLINNNSSAAGAHLYTFPALIPSRTFIAPHGGTKAAYIHCAGAPLQPSQRLDFAAAQQAVSMWIAVEAPVSIAFVIRGSGPDPIQSFTQGFPVGSWTQVTINAPGPVIRGIQMTSVTAGGSFSYIDWAIDDLSFTGPVQACGASDIGSTGGIDGADGQLNNNDFVVFIDRFFGSDPRADVGVTGGVPGTDQQFNNNDFVVFIDQFFAAC